jgi:hypothetical protein
MWGGGICQHVGEVDGAAEMAFFGLGVDALLQRGEHLFADVLVQGLGGGDPVAVPVDHRLVLGDHKALEWAFDLVAADLGWPIVFGHDGGGPGERLCFLPTCIPSMTNRVLRKNSWV